MAAAECVQGMRSAVAVGAPASVRPSMGACQILQRAARTRARGWACGTLRDVCCMLRVTRCVLRVARCMLCVVLSFVAAGSGHSSAQPSAMPSGLARVSRQASADEHGKVAPSPPFQPPARTVRMGSTPSPLTRECRLYSLSVNRCRDARVQHSAYRRIHRCPHLRRDWAHPLPHLHRDWAHRCPHLRLDWAHRCPHLRLDWAHPCHICTWTGLTRCHICTGTRLAR
jgi:hypothetical protein